MSAREETMERRIARLHNRAKSLACDIEALSWEWEAASQLTFLRTAFGETEGVVMNLKMAEQAARGGK